MFLHDAIFEALMCGDTSIAAPVKDAKEKVAELAKVEPKTGMTGFETQFEVCAFIIIDMTTVIVYTSVPTTCLYCQTVELSQV